MKSSLRNLVAGVMTRFSALVYCSFLVLIVQPYAASLTWGAEPPTVAPDTASRLAAAIDRRIEAAWADKKVVPAPVSTDAEFARRVYLDLIGRIPRVAEIRRFLADTSPNKRERLVDELLQRPAFAAHFAGIIRGTWMPQTRQNPAVYHLGTSLEDWLRPRIQRGDGYHQLVKDLLTVPLSEQTADGALADDVAQHFGAVAWYQIHDLKAENMVSATTRLMLGIRLECAQCHNHPFDKWSQDQFWQMAAFFSRMEVRRDQPHSDTIEVSIAVPQQDRSVKAMFLNQQTPVEMTEDPRAAIAQWMIAADNPFFARATANRFWAIFLGRGLVHPVDDFRADNPPSHPELLDELASSLHAQQFDLQFLIRAITRTQVYQRSSRVTDPSQNDPALFARMLERPLLAEQLWDSLTTASGYQDPLPLTHRGLAGLPNDSPRSQFIVSFLGEPQPDSPQISILHSLKLLHGEFVVRVTSPQTGPLVTAVSEAPFLNDNQRVETLYLASFARLPDAKERQTVLKFVTDSARQADRPRAWGDVLWTLINSPEFLLNH